MHAREITKIHFKSSCKLGLDMPGYVTVSIQNFNIPLSIFGLHSDTISSLYNKKLLDPKQEVEYFLQSRNISTCTSCQGAETNSHIINYMVENNYFQHIFLSSVSKMLPSWFNIKPMLSQMTSVTNLKAVFGQGTMLQTN